AVAQPVSPEVGGRVGVEGAADQSQAEAAANGVVTVAAVVEQCETVLAAAHVSPAQGRHLLAVGRPPRSSRGAFVPGFGLKQAGIEGHLQIRYSSLGTGWLLPVEDRLEVNPRELVVEDDELLDPRISKGALDLD